MNYIIHLNAVMKRFSMDNRLNPTHVSLYMALFQIWNFSHFSHEIFINREEIMKMSKIGSKGTYHRCLKQLHAWKYLIYLPSHNPYKSSQIRFLKFGTTRETTGETTSEKSYEQVVERALVSNNKQLKQLKQPEKSENKPRNKQEVLDFFIEKEWAAFEAEKFYNYYEGIGWKLGGKIEIFNWKAVAEKWILRTDESEIRFGSKKIDTGGDNLQTVLKKNYGKPL